jgi:predicted ATPase
MQQVLQAEPWETPTPLRVRAALHTGEADLREGDYYGSAVNRCARLRSAAHGGQTLLSRTTYDLVHDSLPAGVELRDLGEHLLRDLQQPEHIFQLVVPSLPSDFPPLKTLDARPNNLPGQRSPLVGRERELAAVRSLLLRDDVGLVTLTGPGGIGKTRLALQVAADLIDEFPDGVYFVALAPVTDTALLAQSIAKTLGVAETGAEMVDIVLDYLSDKRLLLLLDNFEQLVGAAPLVARLLAAAPRLKVLVTSREVLRVRDEQHFAVPALGVPDPEKLLSKEALAGYESVWLFVQRARLVKPDFEITTENSSAVAEICFRLDGLPLAIELAAARVQLLTPQAILARLTSRLRLLTAGPRDLPERQQTLRGAIQWSHDLLQPPEQALFRRMAVFAGGGILEAIESICNSDGSLEVDVLDGVASLVDKSLIYGMGNSEEPRFSMLETIREYATELLQSAEPAHGQEIYRQHTIFYLALAEEGSKGLGLQEGLQQESWVNRLEAEYDNFQAVLTRAIEQGDAQTALRLGGALSEFWNYRGYHKEGSKWLTEALSLPGAQVRNLARAQALVGALTMSWYRNDYRAMRSNGEEAIAILRELGPEAKQVLGWALTLHGSGIAFSGEGEDAWAISEEGVRLLTEAGHKASLAYGLLVSSLALGRYGEFESAQAALEKSLALAREAENNWLVAQVLNGLGDISRINGDYDRAKELYEESLRLYRRLNTRGDLPASLHNLGYVALARGEVEEAKRLFTEALNLQLIRKNRSGIAECLAGLAGVAGAEEQKGIEPQLKAARLFGATEALYEAIGVENSRLWPAETVDLERNLAKTRARLGAEPANEVAWQKSWQEGRAMTMEQAVAYALDQE